MPVRSNIREWQAALRDVQRDHKQAVRDATPAVARYARDQIRARIPPGATESRGMTNRFPGYAATGNLKSAIVAGPVRVSGDTYSAAVGLSANVGGFNAMKALVHEYGMVIRAKNVPYMTFQIMGKWVRVKRVRIRAKRFFRAGMDEAARRFPEIVAEHLTRRFPARRGKR